MRPYMTSPIRCTATARLHTCDVNFRVCGVDDDDGVSDVPSHWEKSWSGRSQGPSAALLFFVEHDDMTMCRASTRASRPPAERIDTCILIISCRCIFECCKSTTEYSDFLIHQWHMQCDRSQPDCVWVMQKQCGVSLSNNVQVWLVWALPFSFLRPSYRRHTAACTVRRSVEGHTSFQSWCSADIWSQWMRQWCYSTDMASAERKRTCYSSICSYSYYIHS